LPVQRGSPFVFIPPLSFASVFSDCVEAVWIDLKRMRCVRSFSLSLSMSSTLLCVGRSSLVIVFLIWKGLYLGFHDWLVGIFPSQIRNNLDFTPKSPSLQ
jgi:hypothetical protein